MTDVKKLFFLGEDANAIDTNSFYTAYFTQ
jgi:hypothetical protein